MISNTERAIMDNAIKRECTDPLVHDGYYEVSPEAAALKKVNEEFDALEHEAQREVHEIYETLIAVVEDRGEAGVLALALLCAEIDAGVRRT
jgi:hypothetical protein